LLVQGCGIRGLGTTKPLCGGEIWKSEEWGGKFEDCYNWEVGKGRDIMFWEDDWVGFGVLKNRVYRVL